MKIDLTRRHIKGMILIINVYAYVCIIFVVLFVFTHDKLIQVKELHGLKE